MGMGMGIDDLLCKEYKPAKRTNLLNDESQMIPLMDLENSEAVVNFDGSYFKFETALDSVANDLALVKNPICTAHAEAVHGHERPRISFEELGVIMRVRRAFQIV
jgi:hypothetical protein